ncbi:MAG: autotransporter-associated beta strand repeat-containing protein [Prosthecobacter sp.]|uniref:autotransporter-associated beta strand repeat-containing protein n=1 Tax=Prosthecobacter sp. TaxID=1965333 RepID=UPI0038FE90DD
MKQLRAYRRSIGMVIITLLLILMLTWQIGQPLQGATIFLDVNGATVGAGEDGGGNITTTWDTSAIWSTDSTGNSASAAWNNVSNDTAVFSAGAGATGTLGITVSGTQIIGGLTFEEGATTLTGGTLNLGAASSFNVASGLTATVNSGITFTNNLTKTGGGTLVLGGSSTGTGLTIISGGTLSIAADNNLGDAPAAVVANQLQIGGGGRLLVNTGFTMATNRGITINAGGATIDAGTNTLIYGGVITSTGSNTFTITSGAGGRVTLTGANSIATNTLTISSGSTLRFGAGTAAGGIGASANNLYGNVAIVNNGTLEFNRSDEQAFSGVISGSGSLLKVSGSGTVNLTGANTFTGDVTIASGSLRMGNNGAAGTLGSGSTGMVFNSGTLIFGRTDGTIAAPVTVDKKITGTGAITKDRGGVIRLTNANDSAGTVTINTAGVIVSGNNATLNGNTTFNIGDFNGADEFMIFGATTDVVAGTLNRINDGASVNLRSGGYVDFNGPAAGSGGFEETFLTLATDAGRAQVTLTPASGQEIQVSATNLTRTNSGTIMFRGTNLGGTGASSSRIIFGTAPTLTGGGGGSGTQTISVLPWAVGDISATGAGSAHVTHGATGIRPLANGEYDSLITGTTASRNVSVAGGESVNSDQFINALRVTAGTTTLAANSSVSVASGALLFTGAHTIGGASGSLDFGATNGSIFVSSNTAVSATISSRLSGNAGFILSGSGFASGAAVVNTLVLSGDNKLIGGIRVHNGSILQLGSTTALNDNFLNAVNLQTGSRLRLNGNSVSMLNLNSLAGGTTQSTAGILENNNATAATLRIVMTASQNFEGQIINGTGGALSLVKTGANNLVFTGTNHTYTGSTTINQGLVQLTGNGNGTNGSLTGTTAIIIAGGSTLRATYGDSNNNNNRINNSATLTLRGGTFDFDVGGTVSTVDTIATLIIDRGFNTVTVDTAASAQTSVLTFTNALARTAGAIVNFTPTDANGLSTFAATRGRLVFTTAPTLDDGIIRGATFGTELATYETGAAASVRALATYSANSNDQTAWVVADNVKPTAATTLTAGRNINAAVLNAGLGLALGTFTLNVESGMLLGNGNAGDITNGTLTAGGAAVGELMLRVDTGDTQDFATNSVIIADNGTSAVSFTKFGAGTLVLNNSNTYTGATSLIGGIVTINSDNAFGTTPPGAVALRQYATTLNVNSSMTLNANRAWEFGGGNSIVSIAAGTAGNGKTLTYNGTIASSGDGNVTFQSNATTTNVDPGKLNATLAGVLVTGGNFTVEAGTVALAAGNNVIGRSLIIGSNGTTTLTQTSGNLTVGSGVAGDTLDVGISGADTISKSGTLTLTGVTQFTANVDTVRLALINGGTVSVPSSTVTLATNNDITAGTSIIQSETSTGGAGPGSSSLVFGSGTNNVTTPLWTVGGRKGAGSVTIAAGGTLNIMGFADYSTQLFVGRNNVATGGSGTHTFNMTGGTLNANLSLLTLGLKSTGTGGIGGSTATFTLDNNVNHRLETLNMSLGDMSGASGTVTAITQAFGTFTMANGTVSVLQSVAMGTYAGTLGTAKGIINLSGGTFTVAGDITKTANDRSGAVITITGGTLDLQNQAIGDTTAGNMTLSQLIWRAGAVQDVGTVTLDGRGVTDGISFANEANALVLRDVSANFAIALTNGAANAGGILYEAAGAGAGGTLSGTLNLGTVARTINVEDNGSAANDLTISGLVSGSGNVTKSGLGRLVLSNASNNYTGKTLITAGTVQISADGNLGTAPGAAVVDQLTLSGGGILASTADATLSTNRGITIGVGGGAVDVAVGTTLTSSAIVAGTTALSKTGAGTLVLGGVNGHSGTLAVSAGKLFVNGSTNAGSAVTVSALATLGGTGTVNGATTVASTGIIEAGFLQSGSLNLAGGVTFGSGATDTATINLANVFGGSPSILNAGALTINSGTAMITINIANSGSVSNNTYTLFDYSGSIGGSGAGFAAFKKGTIGGLGGRQSALLVDDATNSLVALTISGDSPKWTGFDATASANSSVWHPSNNLLLNWKLISDSSPTDYRSGDQVLFDDDATGSYVVDISSGNVDPVSVEFNNSNGVGKTYTLQGSNGITGSTGLTKSNTGTLIINNANSFTGGITQNNGTITLGNTTALGTGNSYTFGAAAPAGTRLQLNGNNATVTGLLSAGTNAAVENSHATLASVLTVNLAAGTNTFAGTLQNGAAGILGLTKQGAGTLILTGTGNTNTGGTTISAGILQVGNGTSNGSLSGDVTDNATLTFNPNTTITYAGIVSGSGVVNVTTGTLALTGTLGSSGGNVISGGATLNIGNGGTTGSVTSAITANGTLIYNRTDTSTLGGNITGTGSFTVQTGTAAITGTNSYGGGTTINASATLQVGNGGTAGSFTGAVTDNGTLTFSRSDAVTYAGNITGSGAVRQSGTGTTTLSGTNGYAGATIIDNGILRLGSAGALPVTTALTIGATGNSSTLDLNSLNTTVTSLATAGTAANQTITNNGNTAASVLTVSSAVANTFGGLIKNGATRTTGITIAGGGILTLTNANTYTGGTIVSLGTAKLGVDDAFGLGALTLGSVGNVGILDLNGNDQSFTTIATAGTAASQLIGNSANGTTSVLTVTATSNFGGLIQNNFGGGQTGITAVNVASGTLTLNDAPATYTGSTSVASGAAFLLGSVTNHTFSSNVRGAGVFGVSGTNIVTYTGTATQTGDTRVTGGGTLKSDTDNNLSSTAVLNLGNAGTTVGHVDFTNSIQSVAGLVVSTNTATANTITIGASETLTSTGNVTLGTNANANPTTTNVNFLGGGSFVVNANGGNFQVGGATTSGRSNAVNANLSGLTTFTADLGTSGIFRLGDTADTSQTVVTTLTLAANNTITTNLLGIGQNTGSGAGAKTLNLGATTNVINANTISIGETGNQRGSGILQFAGSTGTLTVRSAAGATGLTNLNMVNNASSTGTQLTSQVLLAGHTVDVSLNQIVMAARSNGSTQGADATLTFDTGIFSANSTSMVTRTGAALTTGSSTGTITIGTTTASTGTASLGSLTMAVNTATSATASPGTATALLTMNGGTLNTGAINMANAVVTGISKAATATINLLGGTTNISGSITRSNGGGTENTTLSLNGATAILNLNGNSIGSGTAAIGSGSGILNMQAGTLRNVGEINGGATWSKSGAATDILTLDTSNAFTGTLNVTGGILRVQHGSALGGVTNGTSVSTGTALEISGGITTAAEGLTLSSDGISSAGALRNTSGSNTWAGLITLGSDVRINSDSGTLTLDVASGDAVTGAFNLTIGGAGNVTVADAIATGAGTLTKDGAGTLVLSGVNSYTGTTTLTGTGKLYVNGSLNVASAVSVGGGTTFGGSGTANGIVTVASTGIIEAGQNQVGSLTAGSLVFGATATDTATIMLADINTGSASILNAGALVVNTNAGTITIHIANTGAVVNGTYLLIDHTGAITGTGVGFSAFTLGTISGLGARQTPTLVQNASNADSIDLMIVGDTPKWTGALSNEWSTFELGGSKNWKLVTAGTATDFRPNDTVLFDDTASSGAVDISVEDVTPTSVEFNNSTLLSYTLTGTSGITGASGIIKNGTGTVTISSVNAFTGTVAINSGVIRIASASALGGVAGGTTVSSGAALEISGGITTAAEGLTLNGSGVSSGGALRNISGSNTFTGAVTLASATRINADADTLTLDVVSGSAITGAFDLTLGGAGNLSIADTINLTTNALVKDGTGNATLGAANTFGAVTVNAGTLRITHASALGSTAAGTTVNINAALEVVGGITTAAELLSLDGTGVANGGALRNVSGSNTYAGNITLAGNSRINSDADLLTLNVAGGNSVSGSFNLALGGAGNITVADAMNLGTATLTKDGVGTVTLTTANTVGAVVVDAGALRITQANALGNTGTGTTVNSGGALELQGGITTASEPLSLGSAGVSSSGGLRNVSGSNTYAGSITLAGNSRIHSDAGVLALNVASGPAVSGAFDLTFGGAGNITVMDDIAIGAGAITKEGAGTLILSAVNTNTGTTTVNAGVLGGTGAVGGNVIVNNTGTLAPGASAGRFTIEGGLTVNDGGTLLLEIGGVTFNDEANVRSYFNSNGNLTNLSILPAYETYNNGVTLHDHILVNSTTLLPTIDGTVKLTNLGHTFAYGDIFDLMDWGAAGSIGGIDGLTFDYGSVTLGSGLAFNFDLFASQGLVVVVPEPSRVVFLMLGLFGLMLRRRRR